ncbi:MAG TPA: galactokinase family protein [Gemmatimonadaceae bacterium]|nr:galactokinase family protein [Gemmatimonadaceae bacterium]
MSDAEAPRKEALFARAAEALTHIGASTASAARFWVPGRIEFLGKHTDYAGGRSLLCAIERGFCVAAVARPDGRIRVCDAVSGELIEGEVHPETRGRRAHWSAYPLTVAHRIAANFSPPLVGADMAFASDLPIASGISSSSALVVATYLVLGHVNDLAAREEFRRVIAGKAELAEYLGAVENGLTYRSLTGERGVGTFGGSEDHTAILCGQPRALVQYSFCPVRFERAIPLKRDHAFVIASSGVMAEKTGAALESYNRLATLAHAALDRWRRATGRTEATLGDAIRVAGGAESVVDAIRSSAVATDSFTVEQLAERVRQFAIESEQLIPAAGDALSRNAVDELGAVVDRSMRNAVTMLHNQIDETIFLAARARELGAVAASAFGAGFGGSVWALASRVESAELAERLLADYRKRFPGHTDAEVFVTPAGPPATTVW